MTPLNDTVIIRRHTGETQTASGLHIPQKNADEKRFSGIVLAVGEGRTTDAGIFVPTRVKVGQSVCWRMKVDAAVKIDGEDLVAIPEHDLTAILGD